MPLDKVYHRLSDFCAMHILLAMERNRNQRMLVLANMVDEIIIRSHILPDDKRTFT